MKELEKENKKREKMDEIDENKQESDYERAQKKIFEMEKAAVHGIVEGEKAAVAGAVKAEEAVVHAIEDEVETLFVTPEKEAREHEKERKLKKELNNLEKEVEHKKK